MFGNWHNMKTTISILNKEEKPKQFKFKELGTIAPEGVYTREGFEHFFVVIKHPFKGAGSVILFVGSGTVEPAADLYTNELFTKTERAVTVTFQ